jgi:hypothetical protein
MRMSFDRKAFRFYFFSRTNGIEIIADFYLAEFLPAWFIIRHSLTRSPTLVGRPPIAHTIAHSSIDLFHPSVVPVLILSVGAVPCAASIVGGF